MNDQNFFEEVANLLQVLEADYKYGLSESIVNDNLSSLESLKVTKNYSLYGVNSPKVLFVFSYSSTNLKEFLESLDGILFSKLFKNTKIASKPLSLLDTSILITKDIDSELFSEVFQNLKMESDNMKVILLGEEYQEEFLAEINGSENFLFTCSLQEIRNSLKQKKVFWEDYQNYLS